MLCAISIFYSMCIYTRYIQIGCLKDLIGSYRNSLYPSTIRHYEKRSFFYFARVIKERSMWTLRIDEDNVTTFKVSSETFIFIFSSLPFSLSFSFYQSYKISVEKYHTQIFPSNTRLL